MTFSSLERLTAIEKQSGDTARNTFWHFVRRMLCVAQNCTEVQCHRNDIDLDKDAQQDMVRCDADRHPLMPADADTQPAVAAQAQRDQLPEELHHLWPAIKMFVRDFFFFSSFFLYCRR